MHCKGRFEKSPRHIIFCSLPLISVIVAGCGKPEAPANAHNKQNPAQKAEQDPNVIREDQLLSDEDALDVQLEKATQYIKENPSNGRGYAIRSMILGRPEKRDEQIADLNNAISLLTNDPDQKPMLCESYYARGLAFQALGKDELALLDFNSVLELDNSYASALQARGYHYFIIRKLDLAINDLDRAVKLTPEDPYDYELRSRIRRAQGDEEGAELDLTKYGALLFPGKTKP